MYWLNPVVKISVGTALAHSRELARNQKVIRLHVLAYALLIAFYAGIQYFLHFITTTYSSATVVPTDYRKNSNFKRR